mgnify:CR=1 FL=1
MEWTEQVDPVLAVLLLLLLLLLLVVMMMMMVVVAAVVVAAVPKRLRFAVLVWGHVRWISTRVPQPVWKRSACGYNQRGLL